MSVSYSLNEQFSSKKSVHRVIRFCIIDKLNKEVKNMGLKVTDLFVTV